MSSPSSQGGPRGTNRDREKPVAIHIPERSGQNNILVTEAGKDSTTTNSIPILIKSGPGSPRVASSSTTGGCSPPTQLVVVTNNGPHSNNPSLPPNHTQLLPVLSVAKAAAGEQAAKINGQLTTSTNPDQTQQGTNGNSTITVYPWHSLVPFLTTGESPTAPSTTSTPNNPRGPNNHQDKDKQPPGSGSSNNNNNNNNSTGVFKVEQSGGREGGGEGSNGPVKELELPEPSPDEEDDVFFFEECPTPTTPG